jgi:hypothetical protein
LEADPDETLMMSEDDVADTPDVAAITEHEAEQVDRANATGLQPVVFVHGLWLLPSSWDRWAVAFEAAGYTALTPGWPDDPETAAEANANPEVFPTRPSGRLPTTSRTSSTASRRSRPSSAIRSAGCSPRSSPDAGSPP